MYPYKNEKEKLVSELERNAGCLSKQMQDIKTEISKTDDLQEKSKLELQILQLENELNNIYKELSLLVERKGELITDIEPSDHSTFADSKQLNIKKIEEELTKIKKKIDNTQDNETRNKLLEEHHQKAIVLLKLKKLNNESKEEIPDIKDMILESHEEPPKTSYHKYKKHVDEFKKEGYSDLAALVMYGNNFDLETYLQNTAASLKGRISVAKIASNKDPYELTMLKGLPGIGRLFSFFYHTNAAQTVDEKSYCSALVNHTGLFSLHFYLKSQIELKAIDNSDVAMKLEVMRNIITFLNQNKNSQTLKNDFGIFIDTLKIPTGYISCEFKNLCYGLKQLKEDKLKIHIEELSTYLKGNTHEDVYSLKNLEPNSNYKSLATNLTSN